MPRWTKCAWVGAACLGLAFPAGAGDTHYVSLNGTNNSPYTNGWANASTNIQWAINVATNGDTVLVSNGTYNLTNTISITTTKAVTLLSLKGRDDTTLKMDLTWGSNRCIYMTTTGTVDGFTIANGCGTDYGGGVYMTAGTLQNCTVVSNSVTNKYGGGIYAVGDGTRVFNCIVAYNTARDYGGGVYMENALMGSNCVISGNSNSASGEGGDGVLASYGARVIDCVVSNNYARVSALQVGVGGAGSGAYVSNCIITDNRGPGYGMRLRLGSTGEYCVVKNNQLAGQSAGCVITEGAVLRNSFIHNNNTNLDGNACGLWIQGGAIAESCVISNNYGWTRGSGVRLPDGTLRNCLVIANTGNGAGVRSSEAGTPKVENCTIARNDSGIYATNVLVINTIVQSNTVDVAASAQSCFTNCNVNATGLSGSGNINTNPAWVDPANYNFRLTASSLCIDAGMQAAWMTGAKDLDGYSRIDRFSQRVDMGCYEFLRRGIIFSGR